MLLFLSLRVHPGWIFGEQAIYSPILWYICGCEPQLWTSCCVSLSFFFQDLSLRMLLCTSVNLLTFFHASLILASSLFLYKGGWFYPSPLLPFGATASTCSLNMFACSTKVMHEHTIDERILPAAHAALLHQFSLNSAL